LFARRSPKLRLQTAKTGLLRFWRTTGLGAGVQEGGSGGGRAARARQGADGAEGGGLSGGAPVQAAAEEQAVIVQGSTGIQPGADDPVRCSWQPKAG